MYILYAFSDGKWTEHASFKDRRGYAEQVKTAAAGHKAAAKNEQLVNASIVMEDFVLGGYAYAKQYGKLVMRALRNFDEVGLSADICESLEELLDEGCEKFALVKADQDVTACVDGEFSVRI